MIGTAAARASLAGVHPHTLRHSCGFALADKGHDLRLIQDYLGHRDPRHTVHYTRTPGGASKGCGDERCRSHPCIRRAGAEDAEAIAPVHVAAWREAYRRRTALL